MATCRAEGPGLRPPSCKSQRPMGLGPSVLIVRLRTSLHMWFPVITSLRL